MLALIEKPEMVAAIRSLPAKAMHTLIARVGLEDAHPLIALATREQLERVLDEDLWEQERFDPARFGVWLEVMLELGAKVAASRVAELDPDLFIAALLHHTLVLDPSALQLDAFGRAPTDEDLADDNALEGTLSVEIGGFLVVARRHDAWDAITQLLVELDAERILERCARICAEEIAEDGLHHVLSLAQQVEEDLAAAREDRRAKLGHVDPRAARAFLKLAAETPLDARALPIDPLTRAYFRELESQPVEEIPPELAALVEEAAPAMKRLPRRALPIMRLLKEEHGPQLAYLANVLVAALSLRPVEAAEEALEHCNRGYEHSGELHDLLTAFRVGWRLAQEAGARAATAKRSKKRTREV